MPCKGEDDYVDKDAVIGRLRMCADYHALCRMLHEATVIMSWRPTSVDYRTEDTITKKDVDGETRALCELLSSRTAVELKALDDVHGLTAWWKAHQEWDRRREAQEKAAAEREQLRKDTLASLTQKQKDVLGIHDEIDWNNTGDET